jgi:hypothetical protein
MWHIVYQKNSFIAIYLCIEEIKNIPRNAGQICKIINPMEDENPNDVYIVTEDTAPFDLEDSIYTTNLKD